ncbi:4'-phosphopantetheine phosphatase [Drosophila grimshawi]|uniref:4'-phosphopantetheine phosphatase n=1 Tax=Drosophila grimshawi TaxID=7222 RepID=B4JAT5_DROGR|nr:4'-phosphopantetheine phosphatase [Drosophila grimshawi]EDW03893.1 GH11492 [Drosophila grimshawi]
MYSCSLFADESNYQPDTLDLNTDAKAADYWFPCFRELVTKYAKQAAVSSSSQCDGDDADDAAQRAAQFQAAYLGQLQDYQDNIANNRGKVVLGTSELLKLNETMLRRFGFSDPWRRQKQQENASAKGRLKQRLQEIDAITDGDARWTELVRGVLAGNMFDWGAQAVATILEQDSNFGLHAALERIEQRPWLLDNLDAWLQRMRNSPEQQAHKCAVVFVDNSGVDVVLGILPFVRELLRRGTKVLLCANSEPSLNDVTSVELSLLLDECACECSILAHAWLHSQRLLVYANGQSGPCLDMRTLPRELCDAITANETDLLVIEGMGRALHTNLNAQFKCETLKLAVVKNRWLAKYLGGDKMFPVICKYEEHR